MTTVYFIRHAQSDHTVRAEAVRPLTEKGLRDRALVTQFLRGKGVSAVYSSPYKRAMDTVAHFAESAGLEITTDERFRERKVDSVWIEDFAQFHEHQWANFAYKLSEGESLAEVQLRNIAVLEDVLARHDGEAIAIGTHGTALSTIINYFDSEFGYAEYCDMRDRLPWVAEMRFEGGKCAMIETYDLLNPAPPNLDAFKLKMAPLGSLGAYQFTVVFARYRDKWLYCRAKNREGFEPAGGHIENGESPLECAKRELIEETGAVAFDITPAFDYQFWFAPAVWNSGQIFFANISELGELPPDFEMAEVRLFDAMPDVMRFPYGLPQMYEKMQMWLNLQSAADELWDIYDASRNPKGRTHRRGDPLPHGDYHIVVHVWLMGFDGRFLITQRAPTKGYPLMWETTGGSAVAGDDSLSAALREVREETGLTLLPENGTMVLTKIGESYIGDAWLFRQEFDLADVVLQEGETVAARYATAAEIREMVARGEFFAHDRLEEVLEFAKGLR